MGIDHLTVARVMLAAGRAAGWDATPDTERAWGPSKPGTPYRVRDILAELQDHIHATNHEEGAAPDASSCL